MDESAGQQQPFEHAPPGLRTADTSRDRRWSQYVRRAASGDSQALADLYDESSTLLFSIATRILANHADAEEITLDVYTYVWRSAAQFDDTRGSVTTWLVMLTRSRAIDRLRSIGLRVDQVCTNGIVGNPSESSLVFSDASNYVYVRNALQHLTRADRELLELVFYSGLSHSELAAAQNAPLGTVKTRVRAALGRLRKLLGEA